MVERIGEFVSDRAKRRVTLAGRPLRLTITEYRMLRALSLNASGVATQ
ncbi:MAG: response regulator transcription factor [Chloroflexi bacterium]|nr:response regulator transcription factor [Chloroflexota bacterium]